jgi:hypothetical protein
VERVVDPHLPDVEPSGQTSRAGHIAAPDAGREPGLVAVDPVDRVFGDVHRRDGDDRPLDFLIDDAHPASDIHHHSREAPVGTGMGDASPTRGRVSDEFAEPCKLTPRQAGRSAGPRGGQGIPEGDDQGGGQGALDEDELDRYAVPAAVGQLSPDEPPCGPRDHRIRQDDCGVPAGELEDRGSPSFSLKPVEREPRPGAPGKEELVDPGGNHRLGGLGLTGHDSQHTLGQARALEEGQDGPRDRGADERRLPEDGIPAQQRAGDLRHGEEEERVCGADHVDVSERVPVKRVARGSKEPLKPGAGKRARPERGPARSRQPPEGVDRRQELGAPDLVGRTPRRALQLLDEPLRVSEIAGGTSEHGGPNRQGLSRPGGAGQLDVLPNVKNRRGRSDPERPPDGHHRSTHGSGSPLVAPAGPSGGAWARLPRSSAPMRSPRYSKIASSWRRITSVSSNAPRGPSGGS